MKLIHGNASFEILHLSDLKVIEKAGRTCYQSAVKEPTEESARKFVQMIIDRGHESVLEHGHMTVAFDNCSRGLTHELVRHRMASFSQESTRYVDYTRPDEMDLDRFELGVVCPPDKDPDEPYSVNFTDGEGLEPFQLSFRRMAEMVETMYRALRKAGWHQEDARQILPIGTRSRIVVTANFREWRHIFKLRAAEDAHWEIRTVMKNLLNHVRPLVSPIFDDVGV